MTNINIKDDVMTLLVHLGYLAFDSAKSEVFIPNQEVADEFKNAVETDESCQPEKDLHGIKPPKELFNKTNIMPLCNILSHRGALI